MIPLDVQDTTLFDSYFSGSLVGSFPFPQGLNFPGPQAQSLHT